MKLIHSFALVALIPCIVHAQHIQDSSTKITFNNSRKTVAEWVRDDRNNEFGKTKILTIASKSRKNFTITATSAIATLEPNDFKRISAGCAFYCSNIKKKNGIEYGIIVIDPDQYHFDREKAQLIRQYLINQYIEKQLRKDREGIKLEDSAEK